MVVFSGPLICALRAPIVRLRHILCYSVPHPQKAKDKYNKQDHYPKLNDVTFTSKYVCYV